ncbi:MAG: SufS family cysteine desulfurase [Bdellovibrionaceae bacterium]|nr:SufS family cysteine desulfurase [Pseudobdellovibrionaceae bacterium]NUM57667.1 SufS family cysteine desulfurase [Pseudobdellovibrionaceae bacterium]
MQIEEVRSHFPALTQKIYDKELIYLDSAATTLKPKEVIDRINHYYSYENSNVHRGAHYLSQKATDLFEEAREEVSHFINAESSAEVVFVKGTTEGINLIAASFGSFLSEGDEIIVTVLEHHANIVPWHMLAEQKKIKVNFVHLDESLDLSLNEYQTLLSEKVKLVALTGCSNTLGIKPKIKDLISMAHQHGSKVLIDAAQLVSQDKIDVRALDCDFLVFSGHKLFGPTGIGVLYGKKKLLDQMPPYQGGGAMISDVSEERTLFNQVPFKFEAGTPHIGGVLGMAAAISFFKKIDINEVKKHERKLVQYFINFFEKEQDVVIYGAKEKLNSIVSFNIKNCHHSDVAQLLDQQGIAVRAGHHCTQPLMKYLKIPGTIRVSFSIYNQESDVEKLAKAIQKAKELLL